MSVLSGLKPEKVFSYFEKITQIPHGSTDTKRISDFCVRFAIDHQLDHRQDEMGNVIIWKEGSEGYKDSPSVILQGHLDMVCEKDENTDIDFHTDALRLLCDGENITADGTTLGGDDGIAIAYCLAILDSDELPHPPLECVFTVDEEIGMLGAAALDVTPLRSKFLINIDSEDEGHLLAGCAGGVTSTVHIPVSKTENSSNELYRIAIEGLAGGHSGIEIDKGRANAVKLLGRLLYEISKESHINLLHVEGGAKDNAIPRTAAAVIAGKDKKKIVAVVENQRQLYVREYNDTDPQLTVTVSDADSAEWMKPGRSDDGIIRMFDDTSTDRVIAALVGLPNGVIAMCHEPAGLVKTSLNLGVLKTINDEVRAHFSVRSNIASGKDALVSTLECIANLSGGYVDNTGSYPAWEYREESRLRELFLKVYREQYGQDMLVETIHAGVECGLLTDKIDGLDAVSFGPDMTAIHTPAESLSVSSAARTWELLLGVLKELR